MTDLFEAVDAQDDMTRAKAAILKKTVNGGVLGAITLVQKALGTSYGAAARLVRDLEGQGWITEADHSGRRTILVQP